MALLENVLILLLFLLGLFALLYARLQKKNKELEFQLDGMISKKQSLSTKYGRMTEQFMPFLGTYPYDKQNFRFIGSPIDGVQFEKDKIIFVEFKAGDHQISVSQKAVKELVDKGKVKFEEFRIK
ncbi:MAG: endonuclease [Candidatus Aenigmarchaeota archaeon]|nr:endonuclease [Candidatus Aenigmarchaeota archaeon]